MRYLFICLMLMGAASSALAQTVVKTDQDASAVWDISAQCDALHICNQPAGTAGIRILLDGAVKVSFPVPITFPLNFDIAPLPNVGVHTIQAVGYNCAISGTSAACPVGEQTLPGGITTFVVEQAVTPAPGFIPAPTIVVQ